MENQHRNTNNNNASTCSNSLHQNYEQQQQQQQQRTAETGDDTTTTDSSNDSVRVTPLPTIKQHNAAEIVDLSSSKSTSTSNQTAAMLSLSSSSLYPRWHDAVAGALAGGGSRLVTAPLDLLRIRRQLTREAAAAPHNFYSAIRYYPQLMKKIVLTEQGGVLALFRGNLAATYMWVAYAAVQFSVYTQTTDYLRHSSSTTTTLPSSVIAFISGAVAGVCATLSTYPLDICRTTFAARGPIRSGTSTLLPSSSSASTTAPPTSLWGFVSHLYQTKGWKGFYAGSGPAVIQIIPYMGFNFVIYELVVHKLEQRREEQQIQQAMRHTDLQRQQTKQQQQQQHPVAANSGLAGAIAGATSKFAVYPLDTIKKRLQIQSFFIHSWEETTFSKNPQSSYHYSSMWDCATKMYRTEGLSSFYRGILPSLVKNTVAASLTFAIFTSTKRALQSWHDDDEHDDEHDKH